MSLDKSVNPINNKVFHQATMTASADIDKKLDRAFKWYQGYRQHGDIEETFEKLSNVHALLGQRLPEYAKIKTQEMGKPIAQSEGEIEKCAGYIEYYIKQSREFLQDEQLQTR